ncbi:ORF6N domain-containing protein [bacterium]|nr:ORF6N domain-containing protein [bacterium]MBU1614096.1 ORF6N domain-containing protein [bacterium]
MNSLVPIERIEGKILLIRGQKVMLDRDLAELYGVETGQLTRQVRRNIDRFPADFMLQLTKEEFTNLKCHFGISSWGGTRKLPYAFTEQGVAMLSSVLRSKQAILVNIQIMRAFTKLRQMLATNEEFRRKMEDVGRKIEEHDIKFEIVFEAIEKLISPPAKEIKIGF